MPISVIVDANNKLVGAHRQTSEGTIKTGISPVKDGHVLHTVDLPEDLEKEPLHEVVKRFRIGSDGKPEFTSG
jgi:hypothetical protein